MIRRPPRSTLFPYTSSSDLDSHTQADFRDTLGRQICQYPINADARKNQSQTGEDAKQKQQETLHGQGLMRKRSEEHTSELQSQSNLVCRLLLEKKQTLTYKC